MRKNTMPGIVSRNSRADLTEQTLLGQCSRKLVVCGDRQSISICNAVSAIFQNCVDFRAAHGIPEVPVVFGRSCEIVLFVSHYFSS
jgi:hypothetical protein